MPWNGWLKGISCWYSLHALVAPVTSIHPCCFFYQLTLSFHCNLLHFRPRLTLLICIFFCVPVFFVIVGLGLPLSLNMFFQGRVATTPRFIKEWVDCCHRVWQQSHRDPATLSQWSSQYRLMSLQLFNTNNHVFPPPHLLLSWTKKSPQVISTVQDRLQLSRRVLPEVRPLPKTHYAHVAKQHRLENKSEDISPRSYSAYKIYTGPCVSYHKHCTYQSK